MSAGFEQRQHAAAREASSEREIPPTSRPTLWRRCPSCAGWYEGGVVENPTAPIMETSVARSHGALRIRSLSATDKERPHRMFSRLSKRSTYHRFHMPYPGVPEWVVSRLSDVDRRDTRSFIAVIGDEGVGHALFAREDDEAEFAVVVEDGWQSKGIGRSLLFRLALVAKRHGVETLTAVLLGENWRILGLLEATFPKVENRIKGGAHHVRIPLSALRSVSRLSTRRRTECLACRVTSCGANAPERSGR